jgi:hypothetical protein
VRAFLVFLLAHVARRLTGFGPGPVTTGSLIPGCGPGLTGAGPQSGSLPPGITTRPELAPGHPSSTLGSGITSMPSLCANAIDLPSGDQLGVRSRTELAAAFPGITSP